MLLILLLVFTSAAAQDVIPLENALCFQSEPTEQSKTYAQVTPPSTEGSLTGFTIVRVKYGGGGDWYEGPTCLPNLLKALRERTTVKTSLRPVDLSLTDPQLFDYSFLYLDGHGNISITDDEVRSLRRFLTNGGFLLANDDYGLDKSFRREIQKVLPDCQLVELPFSHAIYHIFYDFPNGLPKIHKHDDKPAQGFGIFYQGRLVVFYDYECDLGDGWDDPEVHNDPPEKREAALRMGINIVLYALTH